MKPLTPYEAVHFNFFMALFMLKKAQEAMEKGDEKKVKQISQYGLIYSLLCTTYKN